MNNQDRDKLTKLDTRMGNVEKQLETIITNHLPHIMEKLGNCSGALKVLIPLVILVLALIAGLYFM